MDDAYKSPSGEFIVANKYYGYFDYYFFWKMSRQPWMTPAQCMSHIKKK